MKTGERDYRDFLEDMAQYAQKGMHIDKEVVWQTLQEDLPPLQQSMNKILQDFCSDR